MKHTADHERPPGLDDLLAFVAANLSDEQAPATPEPRPTRCDAMNHNSIGSERFCEIEDPDHDGDHDAGDLTWPREDDDVPATPARSCLTCEHYLPPMAPEEPCNPDGCGCTGYPPACDIRAEPAGASFPITDCPAWQQAR
jgi:hypothetical protein